MHVQQAAQAKQHGLGRLLASTGVAITGHGMLTAAAPLLAATLTRNPIAISAVSAAGYAAWLLVGLPAGALVDRWPRRAVMVTTDVLRAGLLAALAGLIVTGHATIAALVVCMFLVGVGSCFFDPASQAAIPALVGRDRNALARANGRLWALDALGRALVGPPLGAIAFTYLAVLPFALDSAAFLFSALILTGLVQVNSASLEKPAAGMSRAVVDGLTFLARHSQLRALTLGMAAYNLGYNMVFGILVLFAQDRLNLGDVGFGFLVAAMAIGGVAGGWLAPRLSALFSAFHVYSSALAAQAVGWLFVLATANPWPAAVALVLIGIASTTVSVVGGSARQLLTPDDMLGRMVSVTRLLGIGAAAVGALLGGGLAAIGGLAAPFIGSAGVLLICSGLYLQLARRT